MSIISPIVWKNDQVILLDQRKLPAQEVYVTIDDYMAMAEAIRSLIVRGAPAIGVAGAMGMLLGALAAGTDDYGTFREKLERVGHTLVGTRPTAVNLRWGVERLLKIVRDHPTTPVPQLVDQLRTAAQAVYDEDRACNQRIGVHGAPLFTDGDSVLTHCNAGELCSAGYGTALSTIYTATQQGTRIHVYVDETRPFLQGSRLTAWELQKHGINCTLICDNMAGMLMQQGKIQKIIVGADRIAANGDVANKIGTYSIAVLAQHHNIPMYVAAPCSTIDLQTATGAQIPIEERDPREVTHISNIAIAPDLINVYNPAFDVTPAALVTAIITDRGIAYSPYAESLVQIVNGKI